MTESTDSDPSAAPLGPDTAGAGAAPPPQPPPEAPRSAEYGAPAQPPQQTRSSKKLWIVIAVVVLSLLCFCCVSGGLFLGGSILDDEKQDSTGVAEQDASSEDGSAEEGGDDETVPATLDEVRDEAERMVEEFYPDCELQSLSEVTEGEGTATYDIVVSYLTTPGFRFVLRADRSGGDWALYEADFLSGEYVDPESGALWYHDKLASGVYALLGSDGLFTDVTAPAMTEAYVGLHPDRLVTHFSAVSQIDVEYDSIAESELTGWDGVAWTHRSTWTNDLASNTWVQVGEQTIE